MATLAVTNDFSAGAAIVASEMNTNFTDIETFVNTTPGVLQLTGGTVTGAVTLSNTLTVGADDTGYDVKFFGATAGTYLLWDEDADALILNAADLTVGGGDISLGTTTAGETLNIAGVTTASGGGSNLVVKGGDATGTNQNGGYLAIKSAMGTGSGVSGDILLQTGPAGASGTSQNTATTVLTLTSDARALFSGLLYIGTTDNPNTDGYLNVKSPDATNPCLNLSQSTSTTSADLFTAYSDVGGAETKIAGIEADGTFESATNSYGGTSDERLKTTETCRDYFDDLMELEVVNFQFTKRFVPTMVPTLDNEGNPVLDDDGEAVMEEHPTEGEFVDRDPADYSPKHLGLVAQQVEQHISGLVKDNAYGVKSLKTSVLIPMLVQTVQTLNTRIAALEAA